MPTHRVGGRRGLAVRRQLRRRRGWWRDVRRVCMRAGVGLSPRAQHRGGGRVCAGLRGQGWWRRVLCCGPSRGCRDSRRGRRRECGCQHGGEWQCDGVRRELRGHGIVRRHGRSVCSPIAHAGCHCRRRCYRGRRCAVAVTPALAAAVVFRCRVASHGAQHGGCRRCGGGICRTDDHAHQPGTPGVRRGAVRRVR